VGAGAGFGAGDGEHAAGAGFFGAALPLTARSNKSVAISRARPVFVVGFFFGSGQAVGGIACNTLFVLGQPPTVQALLPAAHFGAARPKIAGMDMGELKALAFCEVLEVGLGAHVVSGMVRQFTA
jgi:hypothetical protein